MFELINGNNYELALKSNINYNQKKNIDISENSINLLLTDICELIKNLSSKEIKTEEKPLPKVVIKQDVNLSVLIFTFSPNNSISKSVPKEFVYLNFLNL